LADLASLMSMPPPVPAPPAPDMTAVLAAKAKIEEQMQGKLPKFKKVLLKRF